MFFAAGLLLTAAFGLFARMAYVEDQDYSARVVVPTVLALAVLGLAITFGVILII
jgi:hypothetical protein